MCRLFRPKWNSVWQKLGKDPARRNHIRTVDGITGVEVILGQIPCVFEFTVYEYKLTPKPEELSFPAVVVNESTGPSVAANDHSTPKNDIASHEEAEAIASSLPPPPSNSSTS